MQEITVSLWGYTGTIHEDGRIGSYTTGNGTMPDAAELRRYADFLLALAAASEAPMDAYRALNPKRL